MIFNYVSKEISVTPAMKRMAESKLSKFESYFPTREDVKCVVTISKLKNNVAVESSITSGSFTLRAKVLDEDFYAAIDLLVDKLEGQLRKVKTQLKKKTEKNSLAEDILLEQISEEENAKEIVKKKHLTLTPMDADEAIARMDALGHKFFIYLDSTSGLVNIIYERDDSSYGNIEVDH